MADKFPFSFFLQELFSLEGYFLYNLDDEEGNDFLAAVHLDNVSVTDNRDSKIHYGEVLLRLLEVKFSSVDVSTCVEIRLSSRGMLFYYGKVLRLA